MQTICVFGSSSESIDKEYLDSAEHLGKTLAENVLKEMVKAGQNTRGAKCKKNANGRDYFAFIRDTACPAVIVECAFFEGISLFLQKFKISRLCSYTVHTGKFELPFIGHLGCIVHRFQLHNGLQCRYVGLFVEIWGVGVV